MPDEQPPLISMAEQFTGLPMDSLIGAPLMAAAKANNMMAVTQTRFMLETCFAFKKGDDNTPDSYAPIMIKMTITQSLLVPGDPDGNDDEKKPKIEPITTDIDLPLLTIIPLNSLAVDEVNIQFDMEVKSSFSEATSEKHEEKFAGSGSFSAKLNYGIFSVSVTGSVSYDSATSSSRDTHYEKSNSAQYSVKVHAGQIPLPQGVTTIINAFTNSITPTKLPEGKGNTPGT